MFFFLFFCLCIYIMGDDFFFRFFFLWYIVGDYLGCYVVIFLWFVFIYMVLKFFFNDIFLRCCFICVCVFSFWISCWFVIFFVVGLWVWCFMYSFCYFLYFCIDWFFIFFFFDNWFRFFLLNNFLGFGFLGLELFCSIFFYFIWWKLLLYCVVMDWYRFVVIGCCIISNWICVISFRCICVVIGWFGVC